MRRDVTFGVAVESEMAVLLASSLATILAAMFGAIVGAGSTGVAGFDNPGYDPTLFELLGSAFLIGCCWSVCPIGILAGVVFVMLLLLGLRLHELRPGFGAIILSIWALGFFNGAIFSVIITLIVEISTSFPSDNVLLGLTIGAGLLTFLIDAIIIFFRYKWLRLYYWDRSYG